MGKVKEAAWLLLLQEKHLGEKKKNWWLNVNQDKQRKESLGEQARAFAAPFIKDIYPATMKQHSFTKQQQQKPLAISGWLKGHVHSPKIMTP